MKMQLQNILARAPHALAAGLMAAALAVAAPNAMAQPQDGAPAAGASCDRACMTRIVDQVLASMVAHDPYSLPLAPVYAATENSHPSALGFMVSWRTITKAGKPDILAIDTRAGTAYFALPVSEAGNLSAFWGRIKVEDRKIAEIELFINRSRGDHGFSFSAENMSKNYHHVMDVPPGRKKATRAELEAISRAAFDSSDPIKVDSAADCQFSEAGSLVIDPGADDVPRKGWEAPLGCMFPPFRPSDPKAREIVIDEELGIIVDAGMVPGTAYPYPLFGHMVSAFIPDQMTEAQQMQDKWFAKAKQDHNAPMLRPMHASGETMQLLQYYDGKLQASQINVHLSGPGMHSPWIQP